MLSSTLRVTFNNLNIEFNCLKEIICKPLAVTCIRNTGVRHKIWLTFFFFLIRFLERAGQRNVIGALRKSF